ncbi:MAG: hypothetical protein HS103_07175 [Anaerolineales bacterium]|nr:hypothetical protein [Anaerolineales bacterium]
MPALLLRRLVAAQPARVLQYTHLEAFLMHSPSPLTQPNFCAKLTRALEGLMWRAASLHPPTPAPGLRRSA